MPHLKFNGDASKHLAQFQSRSLLLRQGTNERKTATQEALANSLALIASVGELEAKFAADVVRTGWLWPSS